MLKLLTIDDEQGICHFIKTFFEDRGYTIFSATSGKEGLEIVQREKPQIVFLDIKMPGMDGFEVLTKIKRFDKKIKVVMLTIIENEKEKAKYLGADDYIVKPFSLDRLEEIVVKNIPYIFEEKGNEK